MNFYLGTHEPAWLKRTAFPLFISRRRLARYAKTFGRSLGPWALDSGAFTELQKFGEWRTSPSQYADEAMLWGEATKKLDFAAIQDWMCEPIVINGGVANGVRFAGTKLSVPIHQRLTIESYLKLKGLAPSIPWAPVLQGWQIDDYLDHVEQYHAAGIDLHAAPVVGVGSVCRRQGTREITELFDALKPLGLRLHGFGLKVNGIKAGLTRVASADSMAWSYNARRRGPLPGHTHKSCANCMTYAVMWREQLFGLFKRANQERLVFAD